MAKEFVPSDEVTKEISLRIKDLIQFVDSTMPSSYPKGKWLKFEVNVYLNDFGEEGFIFSDAQLKLKPAPKSYKEQTNSIRIL